jgi:hypothetical protein
VRIFGREPALIIGFIGAVITRPVAPALFVAALVAVVALFLEYGVDVPDSLVAGLSGLILAGFSLFGIRPQVTPNVDPRPV